MMIVDIPSIMNSSLTAPRIYYVFDDFISSQSEIELRIDGHNYQSGINTS